MDDNDWGGGRIRDLVAVVEAVRELEFVDAGNVFVAGMSFGGFSVMSLVTRYPELVRAGADFFGFTELGDLRRQLAALPAAEPGTGTRF
jgi:dipeptidyl aminopeptidase/acylaminoacyl peptidase